MSIFQSKEWWGAKVGANEEFDPYHLCISNIDNETPEKNKIVIGSFSGVLRVYQPVRRPFKIEDLLYEINLNNPIIQIKAGNFFGNGNTLCVLFFKKMAIYSFVTVPKQGMQTKLLCENALSRNAANMIVGPFGGVKNKDLICVQSCDGMLMVYEQDKLSCMCQISDFILPGPIDYHPLIDCFVIQNSNLEIECYRYSSVGAAFNNSQKENKKLMPDWTFNAGELASDICCIKRSEKTYDLLVLTEQMLFILTHKGTLKAQKKFDYIPSCIYVYENQDLKAINDEGIRPLNFIIGSTTHHILVYQDFQLLWAAKTNYIAHALKVSSFEGMKGLIVMLNDEGFLEVSFLGTEPPKLTVSQNERKEVDYEKADSEYNRTLKEIDNKENNVKTEPSERLNIHSQVMGVFREAQYLDNVNELHKDEGGKLIYARIRLNISYSGTTAQNLTVFMNLPSNLWTPQNPIFIDSIKGNSTPYNTEILLYGLLDKYPEQETFDIHVSYYNFAPGKNSMKDPRVAFHSINIPLALQCRCIPPVKQANFKITVGFNNEIPPLNQMFADLIELFPESSENLANPNVISFALSNGVDSTLLIAKNSNKFRVQSSQFEGLYFVTQLFINRISQFYESSGINISHFNYQDSLPLQDFFTIIDEHFTLRNNLVTYKQELDLKANEFRVIEKRMLTRFKDRNPTPMNNMDFLLQKSYQDIMDLGNKIEEHQTRLAFCSHRLRISTKFVLFLLRIRFTLPDSFYQEIGHYLSWEVHGDENDIGWEEITYANTSYLLKFLSAVSKGDTEVKDIVLQKLDDSGKLKKMITNLLDKIAKYGLNLVLPGMKGGKGKSADGQSQSMSQSKAGKTK